ncbi:glycosyltransferase family 39 protein [Vibrio alginolyticus]
MSEARVRWLLGINLSLLFGFYVYIIFNLALVNDDYMALYTTWLMSVGKRPNLDFNVDSYTLLFDWMTPVYFFFGERFELIYVFRSFFVLFLLAIGWQVYVLLRQIFTVNIALTTLLLLFASSAMVMRGIDLRPDLVILFLWLQIIIVLYVCPGSDAHKLFWVGLLFGLAILFKFKAILIGVVIGLFGLIRLIQKRSVRDFVLDVSALLLGIISCVALFVATVGISSLELFLYTTFDLFLYSTSHVSDANSLKVDVLIQYFLHDIVYWLFALIGVGICVGKWKVLSFKQAQFLIALVILAVLSVLANPHYHAYNLVTLYPILAVFVAFSIQYVVSSTREWSKGTVVTCIVLFLIVIARILHYPVQHNNQHQVALQTFIERHTQVYDAVFAYEGIGLFRPSTYHWRTSAIKIDNYYRGQYDVWQEIRAVKPILIVESYRIPDWLLEEDRDALRQHYVSIAPFILTLGLKTQSSVRGDLLRSGWYVLESDRLNRCFIDGVGVSVGEKIWLNSGAYTLMSQDGTCTLHWYFSHLGIEALRQSNPESSPYLFGP